MDPVICSFSLPFRYAVHFTHGAFQPSNPLVRDLVAEQKPRRILVAMEENVAFKNPQLPRAAADYLAAAGVPASVHVLPGGEAAKESAAVVRELHRAMEAEKLCRHSCVAAIGGGAFLDVAGFAAATLHRGIPLLRFPSTLLAQADAGVGVKNGINFAGKKNLVGTFAPPRAVVNDLDLLATLPTRERRAGLSEAVKVGLIRDAAFFEWIEAAAEPLREGNAAEIETLVRRCAALHIAHIATGGDPFEKGSRRPLDFGHWAAHKLEQMSAFRLRHGEAVAIGIALDSVYAARTGDLSRAELERILGTLQRLGLPLFAPELRCAEELLGGLDEFREHLGGELCVTLLRGIGRAWEVHAMDPGGIRAAIGEREAREARR
ncbi:MAG: 3-dehydroquinate synthase [Chthoniobacteraceae bacterium]|nr:3-dehydroquinate synthase [Chthoniobacteraceae bacterium]